MITDWIECRPTNRETQGMMRFILETCQKARLWSYEKLLTLSLTGDTAFLQTASEETARDWAVLFIRKSRFFAEVPTFAVERAIEEVLEHIGDQKSPESRLANMEFVVEARKGWRKESKVSETISWQQYVEGKRKPLNDRRSVRPEIEVANLIENGFLNFRWGSVKIRGNHNRKLLGIAEKRGIEQQNFLKSVKTITFRLEERSSDTMDLWGIGFTMETEKA